MTLALWYVCHFINCMKFLYNFINHVSFLLYHFLLNVLKVAATGVWSYDTPLWWRIKIKPFALYLINQKYKSSHPNNKI